jgi:hypothetical protein
MFENHRQRPSQEGSGNIEQQLRRYYGPPLPEQSLPTSSWETVRARLGDTHAPTVGRQKRWRRTDEPSPLPTSVTHAVGLLVEHTCLAPPRLHCHHLRRSREPFIVVSIFRPHRLTLMLPPGGAEGAGAAALEVVLATGMARACSSSRLVAPLLAFGGLCWLVLVSGVFLLGWIQHVEPLALWAGILVGIVVGAMLLLLAHLAGCREVFLADRRACSWLGSAQVCEGFQQFVQMSDAPRRGRWGEPALTNRRERLCGARRLLHRDEGIPIA